MKTTKIVIGIIVALLAIFGVYKLLIPGASTQSAQRFGDNSSLSGGLNILLSSVADSFSLGLGANPPVSLNEKVSIGNCNAGSYAASSTEFAISNPFGATSTAQVQSLVGTGNATTTTFLVGTSTLSTGLASTNVSPTLINASVATSSQFTFNSGVQIGSIGFVTPGVASQSQIQVGPNDKLVGYATTTAVSSGAAGFIPGVACTYKIDWLN